MDDIKIIIWIVLGLIYLFSRKRKKEAPQAPQRRTEEEENEAPSLPKPRTFEELLREIQGTKLPEEPAKTISYESSPPRREPKYINYDDQVEDEKRVLEDSAYDYKKEDKIYEVYEEGKKLAFSRPSLEETLKLEDTIVRFKQFKGYESHNRRNLAEEYFKQLKDPQGFRSAFIMSEILKKRF